MGYVLEPVTHWEVIFDGRHFDSFLEQIIFVQKQNLWNIISSQLKLQFN